MQVPCEDEIVKMLMFGCDVDDLADEIEVDQRDLSCRLVPAGLGKAE